MTGIRSLNYSIAPDALRHNLTVAKNIANASQVMVAVKANAYGHGMQRVVAALSAADGFAVATLEEGLALRNNGITQTILVLTGIKSNREYAMAADHRLSLCIHHSSQVNIMEKHSGNHPDVWLMLDTGMHRLGFSPQIAPQVIDRIGANISVLMSHFSDADDPSNPQTEHQLEVFNSVADDYSFQKSIANSAALVSRADSHMDWVRPGIMIYGSSPLQDSSAAGLSLQSAMTIKAPLIAINTIKKGERVGYGGTYACPQDMLVGVVSMGYGDGYPRHAQSGTPVLVEGRLCQLVGRVSMDMLTIDLRMSPDASIGDEVTLWGGGLPVDAVAKKCDTIAYELLCSVGRGR